MKLCLATCWLFKKNPASAYIVARGLIFCFFKGNHLNAGFVDDNKSISELTWLLRSLVRESLKLRVQESLTTESLISAIWSVEQRQKKLKRMLENYRYLWLIANV